MQECPLGEDLRLAYQSCRVRIRRLVSADTPATQECPLGEDLRMAYQSC